MVRLVTAIEKDRDLLWNIVTIQNDKKLYTCTKEILKHRIEGLQMKKV